MIPALALVESKALPWGRIAVCAVLVALGVSVLVYREKLKASRAETAAAVDQAKAFKTALDQLEGAVVDQNKAVKAMKTEGEAQARQVQAAAVTGGRIRAEAEGRAQRILTAPTSPGPAQERERAAALLAAMATDWEGGR